MNPKIATAQEYARWRRFYPNVVPVPEKDGYMTLTTWAFAVDNIHFAAPAGYVFDGASIPRFFWRVTYSKFDPVVMRAALEHDWLCDQRPPMVSSRRAARHFRNLLTHAGPIRREAMYRAVLLGGPQWG